MIDDMSVDQRDEWDGEKDAKAELRDFIRGIRAICGSLPRASASISNSLISKAGFTQVVDFHDSFRYFSYVLMLGERDRLAAPKRSDRGLGRRGMRLAPRFGGKEINRDVFGETPNTAVETTALPMNQNSKYSRLFEFIRGFMPDTAMRSRFLENHKLTRRPSLIKYTAAL
jgi:hypothetical protein